MAVQERGVGFDWGLMEDFLNKMIVNFYDE